MKKHCIEFYRPEEKMPENWQKVIVLLKDGRSCTAEYRSNGTHPYLVFGTYWGMEGGPFYMGRVKAWAAIPSGATIGQSYEKEEVKE